MGVTTLGRELADQPLPGRDAPAGTAAQPVAASPPPPASRQLSEPKLKAPRGTFDVLGEQVAARLALESRARAILEGAGYERIETPAFEATELFARGVGESTDIVSKEMFTLRRRRPGAR